MSQSTQELEVGGRLLRVSNLDKVLYPKAGFAKRDMLDYYARIAPVILPHLKDRPITLKRFPQGVGGPFFYEKNCPSFKPPWMKTAPVWSERLQSETCFCVVNDVASLVWAANLATVELHTTLAKGRSIERPTMLAFDLDPGAPADLVTCCRVGLHVKEIFDSFGLQCFAKTSGKKGLQVYVPLNRAVTYEQTKPFAHAVAQLLEREHPDLVVSRMSKPLRVGRVLVDWSQNDRHKSTVSVYSLRAVERPQVSTPVTWDEVRRVARTKRLKSLVFEAKDVLRRVEELGDLFAPVLTLKQKLPKLQ